MTSNPNPPRRPAAPDRLPPHSLEAEQGVLGCCLLDPQACIGACVELLGDDAKESFYDLRHQTIYAVLAAMFDERKPVDLITVQQRLKDGRMEDGGWKMAKTPAGNAESASLLDQVGGIAYLSQLQDKVPSAANLTYYLDIVKEKALLRRMVRTCTSVVGGIYDYEGEVDVLLDEVEREVLSVGAARNKSAMPSAKDLAAAGLNQIEVYFQRQGQLGGIATGFPDLDRLTDGLHGGEMIVIAARPSLGKTSLAMNFVEHVVLEQQLPVGVFSLEMSSLSLMLRMQCSVARVNLRTIREGHMSEADFPKLFNATGRLSAAPLYIDDTPGLSILQLRARARRLHQQHGCKLFVIDYLQLLSSTGRRGKDNRQQEIADISSGIKALAKELNVPIIVLAQLNRDIEKDKTRKPRLSDLRESGSIEQDADIVGMLYRDGRDEEDGAADASETVSVGLLIAKQRNGPTGEVKLTFFRTYTRFESCSRVSD